MLDKKRKNNGVCQAIVVGIKERNISVRKYKMETYV